MANYMDCLMALRSVNEDDSTDEYSKPSHQAIVSLPVPNVNISVPNGRKRKYNKDKSGSVKHEDSCSVFAKHIEYKMKNIEPEQIKFVHKLISDVLFVGEINGLNENFQLVESKNFEPPHRDYSRQKKH